MHTLHYRPVPLYLVGALGLAATAAGLLALWFL
jgi:hypothetical protein